jgi:hypothetical membrane protein
MNAQTRSNEITRWLAVCGVLGPIMFLAAFTVGGFLRPGYSQVHQAVSDLGVGSNPLLLNGPLVALGVLLTAFVAGFFRSVGPALGPWRWTCAVLLALPGFGFAWAGIFTEAPSTVALQWMVGMPLLAIGTVVGFFVTGLRLRRLDGWAEWGAYSMIAGVTTLGLIVVMNLLWKDGVGRLLERLLFLELLAWYVAVGCGSSAELYVAIHVAPAVGPPA